MELFFMFHHANQSFSLFLSAIWIKGQCTSSRSINFPKYPENISNLKTDLWKYLMVAENLLEINKCRESSYLYLHSLFWIEK